MEKFTKLISRAVPLATENIVELKNNIAPKIINVLKIFI